MIYFTIIVERSEYNLGISYEYFNSNINGERLALQSYEGNFAILLRMMLKPANTSPKT